MPRIKPGTQIGWKEAGGTLSNPLPTESDLWELWVDNPPPNPGTCKSRRFVGVYAQKSGRWYACFTSGGNTHNCGTHATEEAAARAYDAKVLALGLSRKLNFSEQEQAS